MLKCFVPTICYHCIGMLLIFEQKKPLWKTHLEWWKMHEFEEGQRLLCRWPFSLPIGTSTNIDSSALKFCVHQNVRGGWQPWRLNITMSNIVSTILRFWWLVDWLRLFGVIGITSTIAILEVANTNFTTLC